MTEPSLKKKLHQETLPPEIKCLADACKQWDNCPFKHDKVACEMDEFGYNEPFDLDSILRKAQSK